AGALPPRHRGLPRHHAVQRLHGPAPRGPAVWRPRCAAVWRPRCPAVCGSPPRRRRAARGRRRPRGRRAGRGRSFGASERRAASAAGDALVGRSEVRFRKGYAHLGARVRPLTLHWTPSKSVSEANVCGIAFRDRLRPLDHHDASESQFDNLNSTSVTPRPPCYAFAARRP
ncbi:hypothetical protein M885DRAFT_617147, partial [Pelagophyceae sp. CCMP2097]